jgi:acyl-CoA reductase-like NAD-dependent aldehyde dehydrogenase
VLEIPIWRAGRAHTSLDAKTLLSYRRAPLARVSQAPALLVHRTVADLRAAAPGPEEDPAIRWTAIARAGALLAGSDPGGAEAELVTLATGAPVSDSRRAIADLAAGLKQIEEALRWQAPGGDLGVFRTHRVVHPDGKGYAWVPAGQVLGFVAPSNHPAVHLTWVLALAMGYTVAIRPGADDPLTPWRLLQALAAAGFPTERIALLPGGHELVPALVAACDRTVAYGGPSLGGRIGHDGRVLFNGPGSSKVFVDAPVPTVQAADFLLECILHDGGRKCTCASAVVVRGENPGLLDGLAERLADVPILDPLDPAARVPAWKEPALVAHTPADLTMLDGLAFARPGLLRCPDPTRPPFGVEIPAPFATAAELDAGADPFPLLKGSLAVTLISSDLQLRERCIFETTIRKVFTGLVPPWYTEPGAPHQGRLSDFLYTGKYTGRHTGKHTGKFCPEVSTGWT